MEDKYAPVTVERIRDMERAKGLPDDLEFSAWLYEVFLLFCSLQLARGKNARQGDFADWLGISHNNLSQYLLKKRKPDIASADQMSQKLGYGVYDHLGYPRKIPNDPFLRMAVDEMVEMDKEERKEVHETIKNIKARRGARKGKKPDPSFA